jgi:hypothetical protein
MRPPWSSSSSSSSQAPKPYTLFRIDSNRSHRHSLGLFFLAKSVSISLSLSLLIKITSSSYSRLYFLGRRIYHEGEQIENAIREEDMCVWPRELFKCRLITPWWCTHTWIYKTISLPPPTPQPHTQSV